MRSLRSGFRFCTFFLFTFGLYAVWRAGTYFAPSPARWRQRIFRYWARGLVTISAMRIEVIGKPPEPPFLLVSNHLGYTDIAAIRSQLANGVFVAKSDVKGWFLIGKMVSDMQTIFIDRRNRRDIPRAGAAIVARLDEGEGVILFPEGTSTSGERVLPFKSSLLQCGAERNLPVSYLSVSYRTGPDDPPAGECISWCDETPLLVHVWRLLGLKGYSVILNFGEEPVADRDRKKLACDLHREVSRRFVPVA